MAATTGKLTFIDRGSWPQSDRPYELLYAPDGDIPRCNFSLIEHDNVPIHDLRPEKGQLSLDREGYMVVDLESSLDYDDFYDEEKLKRTYLNELKHMLRECLGARAVFVHECVVGSHSTSHPGAVRS